MVKVINLRPFREFLRSGSAGGIILLSCVVISLIISNSPLKENYNQLLRSELGFNTAYLTLRYPVLLWINDGLMAIFFLMVGLEIKRELVEGELSSFKQASLPIFAAIGGAIVPAVIYFSFNNNTNTAAGWGIPMATDIAFAIAIITLISKFVPPSLKVFLAALAIVDDLIAIVVIAIFYSSELHFNYLGYAVIAFIIQLILNRLNVKHIWMYLIPGIFMWYFIHHSGIHATIAGVITAFTLPTTPTNDESPLEKLEHILFNPVNFLIMPLFALANTNITFQQGMVQNLTSNIGLGIILGLLIGKPVGIFITSFFTVKAKISVLPTDANWMQVVGLGLLGGIGFTMSIFIALLSFPGDEEILQGAKISILLGSILAGTLGMFWLKMIGNKNKPFEQ
jgi:NhaA family Na+:H+ antiporter